MNTHSRKRFAGGMTLLVGLLLPALRNARAAGHRIACVSNLRQVGMALTMYQQDTEAGLYPPIYGVGFPPHMQGMSRLATYGVKDKVFFCPLDHNFGPGATTLDPDDRKGHSYVFNAFDELSLQPGQCPSSSQIDNPAELILVGEKKASQTDFYMSLDDGDDDRPLDQVRHNRTANYLFANNHVELLRLGRSLAPQNFWTLSVQD